MIRMFGDFSLMYFDNAKSGVNTKIVLTLLINKKYQCNAGSIQ